MHTPSEEPPWGCGFLHTQERGTLAPGPGCTSGRGGAAGTRLPSTGQQKSSSCQNQNSSNWLRNGEISIYALTPRTRFMFSSDEGHSHPSPSVLTLCPDPSRLPPGRPRQALRPRFACRTEYGSLL